MTADTASLVTPRWPEFSPGRPGTLVLGGPVVVRIGAAAELRRLRFRDGIDRLPGA
ncbi:hypothetical protein [Streptomyces celluloflavus]|uniref:hypothetical protein n=1 Tax=Streptomyces celluloflavus TaxID=58344 RepID=UPI0036CB8400